MFCGSTNGQEYSAPIGLYISPALVAIVKGGRGSSSRLDWVPRPPVLACPYRVSYSVYIGGGGRLVAGDTGELLDAQLTPFGPLFFFPLIRLESMIRRSSYFYQRTHVNSIRRKRFFYGCYSQVTIKAIVFFIMYK